MANLFNTFDQINRAISGVNETCTFTPNTLTITEPTINLNTTDKTRIEDSLFEIAVFDSITTKINPITNGVFGANARNNYFGGLNNLGFLGVGLEQSNYFGAINNFTAADPSNAYNYYGTDVSYGDNYRVYNYYGTSPSGSPALNLPANSLEFVLTNTGTRLVIYAKSTAGVIRSGTINLA
jgi:hypothetical protein